MRKIYGYFTSRCKNLCSDKCLVHSTHSEASDIVRTLTACMVCPSSSSSSPPPLRFRL